MHQKGPQNRTSHNDEFRQHSFGAREEYIDLVCAVIPRSARLEPIHPNRERSITKAINNTDRHPFDRIGLAAERVVGSLLSSHVQMDPRRLLSWRTRLEPRNTIELDGVARDLVLLEYKISFRPERIAKECKRQLEKARNVFLASEGETACRGLGVVVDCGPLVGLPPATQVSNLKAVVDAIRNGAEGYSLKIVSYEEVAEFFKRSPYGAILSPECLRAAWENRTRGEGA